MDLVLLAHRGPSRPTSLRWCGMDGHLMAPPTIGTPVTIRYPTDVLAALDQRAEAEGISRAELLRRIAARYIEETT